MREISTLGHINEDGKLKIHRKNDFLQNIKLFSSGKKIRIELIVKRLYNKRSNEQNRYYWGYIIPEFCRGYKELNAENITKEQAHEFLKKEFLFTEFVNEESGEVKRISKSTSKLTTVEFIEYINECARFINEWFGIEILEPNEQSELIFK